MKKLFALFCLLFIFLFVLDLQAQQWSAEQKEVWAGVETYWAVFRSANPMDFLNLVDDSYYGWYNENGAPSTKADLKKFFDYWNAKSKIVLYTITPARIWVNGNFAYVHYYYYEVDEGADGKPMTERGRWTDILMKKDGKWILVGDHGGKTSN
jgi:hypothetical protein